MTAGPTAPLPAAVPLSTGTAPRPALYEVDPDVVAALVLGCAAVADLTGGPAGSAATYLPGRRVAGVRITPDAVEVHVVARYGPTVHELALQVRRVLVGVAQGRSVDVVVEDLAGPPAAAARAPVVTGPPSAPMVNAPLAAPVAVTAPLTAAPDATAPPLPPMTVLPTAEPAGP